MYLDAVGRLGLPRADHVDDDGVLLVGARHRLDPRRVRSGEQNLRNKND